MSWKSVMQDAQVLLPACADLSEVALPDYAAEKDYLFFEPRTQWTLSYRRMINTALARLLDRQGKKVRYVPIHYGDYLRWLVRENLEDTAKRRAEFIQSAMRPVKKERRR